MVRTAKLTVTVPRELISLADQIAKEKNISRSKVVSACLRDLADRKRAEEMASGYKTMAKEQKHFADVTSKLEDEVVPEWE
ncbi:MAG: DUF6364 family protein [Dehalococcoidales bacterium]|nr:DUF6364 family protein [Dehalococcoidales bacterium]